MRITIAIYIIFLVSNITFCQSNTPQPADVQRSFVNEEMVNELRSAKEYEYIIEESKEQGLLGRVWEELKEYIAQLFVVANKTVSNRVVFSILFIVILGALVFFFLKSQRVGFFEKSNESMEFNLADGTAIDESSDLDKILQDALQKHDYKKAVQLIYIKSIFFLGQSDVVQVRKFKSNTDYQNEIEDNEGKKIFSMLTNDYEYIQFGEFTASADNVDRMNDNLAQLMSNYE